MSAANSLDDQRQSFRCSVADSRQACALKVAAGMAPGRLLDESAGGFSVLVDHPTGLSVGQTTTLDTDSGRFEVQVMHVAETAVPQAVDAQDAQAEPGPQFRLGLRRLRELPPAQPWIPVFAESLRFRLRQWCPSSGLFTRSGMFLVLAATVLPLGLAVLIWNAGPSKGGKAAPGDDSWARSAAPIGYDPPTTDSAAAKNFGGEGFEPAPSGFDGSESAFQRGRQTEAPELFAPIAKTTLRESVERLPGATALALPEVVRRLQLTKEQQEQIRRIEDSTAQAMRKFALDDSLQGSDRQKLAEHRAELLDKARRKALELLTDDQRAKWAELSGPPPPAKQPPAQSQLP